MDVGVGGCGASQPAMDKIQTRGQGLARTCFLASVHFCASDFIGVPTRVQVKGPSQGGGVRGEAPQGKQASVASE